VLPALMENSLLLAKTNVQTALLDAVNAEQMV